MTNALTTMWNNVSTSRIGLYAIATALFAVGFLVDGMTEVGHHVAFILGGMAVGYKISR